MTGSEVEGASDGTPVMHLAFVLAEIVPRELSSASILLDESQVS